MASISGYESKPDAQALAPYRRVHERIDAAEGKLVEEVRDFLRIPGFSTTGEGIMDSARACLGHLDAVGAEATEIVDTGGWPVVTGVSRSKRPDAKWLLIYSLYDQVPVDPADWTVDPLGAEIVTPERLGLPSQIGPLICNRAAINQRGPMLAAIQGIRAMREVEGDIPVNIVWCWEGEEEIGSPNLHVFVDRHRDRLTRCQGMWVPGMRQSMQGSMMVPNGYLGLLWFELACRGGDWGGTVDGRYIGPAHVAWVDAPLMRLIHATGSLFDRDDKVAVDGLRECLAPLAPEDRKQLDLLRAGFTPETEAQWKAILGVKRFRKGRPMGDYLDDLYANVRGNVMGISGGYTGPSYCSILPQQALAKIGFGLPPGLRPDAVLDLVRKHLDARGFHEVTIEEPRGYAAWRNAGRQSVVQAGIRAAHHHGVPTLELPWASWACPAEVFGRINLDIPVSIVGLGHGERLHQPDEYICRDAVALLAKYTVTYLHEWARSNEN
ncbi:MAG: M20/M25/M40 family metallo-hydrolase [Parvibaculaceae bacterium]